MYFYFLEWTYVYSAATARTARTTYLMVELVEPSRDVVVHPALAMECAGEGGLTFWVGLAIFLAALIVAKKNEFMIESYIK